jgi:type I restriction enzyme M protein
MPSKRDVLALLTRDELLATADRFELEVADRRVRDQIFEAVASSKRAGLSDALASLSRDRLKEVCRGLGLDDAGKEKAVLVERLTGAPAKAVFAAAPTTAPVAAQANGASRAAQPPAEKIDISPSDHLTIDRLEGYLWSAADMLRGSIDSSDYKNFIFGLLFLKRLSDRFDEECEALVAGGHDPEDLDEHDFFVPKRARWSEIQKVATNIGETLNNLHLGGPRRLSPYDAMKRAAGQLLRMRAGLVL